VKGGSHLDRKIRFDVYEADPRSGELRKYGLRLPLEQRPFQALLLLLQHANEVVTREELQKVLWPEDVFIDFSHALNTTIAKVRRALNDSADKPRFIETVGRRGYRFIASVEEFPAGLADASARQREAASAPDSGTSKTPTFRWKAAVAASLVCVVLIAGGWFSWHARWTPWWATRAPIHSIAVLPFENVSEDQGYDYVADSINDSLVTDLAKIHNLRVISRTSAAHYQRSNKTIPEIAHELGVDAIVEGSFRRSGTRIRVTAQLIEAQTDRHLWADSYERSAGDFFALESELAHSMARQISMQISSEQEATFSSTYIANPAAYDSYIKGRFFYYKQTRAGYQQSCQYFEQSVASDPGFALAYAGLSECTWQMGSFGLIPFADGTQKAKAAALKAIELDDNSSEAHIALGSVLLFGEWDWAGANREITRALVLNPNNPNAHRVYSNYLWAMGDKEGRTRELKQAKALDPLNPAMSTNLGWSYLWTGHSDLAEQEFHDALNLDPNTVLAHHGLAEIYAQRGVYDQSMAELSSAFAHSSSDPPEMAATLKKIYQEKGYAAAQQYILQDQLKRAQDGARHKQPAACELGIAYADLGDKENALAWMEKGLGEHCRQMMDLKSAPRFDFLRNEPRFHALLRRMKLEPQT
jgi:TolB-like protein/DNA-binding winged helix-turn-helix (wHTH) protein/Tfp pilus assembly protein PilF